MRYETFSALLVSALAGLAATSRADIIVGAGTGFEPLVQVHSPASPPSSFHAYPAGFLGGVRVAAGDINGDGIPDIITGAGAGSTGGHVRVFDGQSGGQLNSFFAYGGFSGGVHVASGDVTGDGYADIVTGAGAGAPGGHVKVFDGATGAQVQSFLSFDGFSGGVRVAAGDIDGDGRADIITSTGVGASGHVKVFSGLDGSLLRSFFAYDAAFQGGVYVAAGDVNGDGRADIVTGTGGDDTSDALSHVKVFDGLTGDLYSSFFAYGGFSGGVRVAAGDLDGDGLAEIVTGTGPGAGPHVKVFRADGGELQSFFAFGPSFTGGIYVAAVPAPAMTLPAFCLLAMARRKRR